MLKALSCVESPVGVNERSPNRVRPLIKKKN